MTGMTENSPALRTAVIGLGPRGLGAIEALITRATSLNALLHIDMFDPIDFPGAGPNFDPEQSPLCLLNIPLRAVNISAPVYPGAQCGEFADWLPPNADLERYPARAELGAYLKTRFGSLEGHDISNLSLFLHQTFVQNVKHREDIWWLSTANRHFGPYDEVLLTQGQPATAPDKQLSRWRTHAQENSADLISAFPANDLLKAAEGWADRSVAIRGLGLSTLDALRFLTIGSGGKFGSGRYLRSGREPKRILPFSLDGYAPVAKPADASKDATYDPHPEETKCFQVELNRAIVKSPEDALHIICEALVPPTMRVLRENGCDADRGEVENWLVLEREKPGSQETQSPIDALRSSIAMAHGHMSPSPGFIIGQLWRKWQYELRRSFDTRCFDTTTARNLINFDEGMKRYSYGPPVTTAEELLMLIEAELVDLRAADDPDILLIKGGWQLVENDLSAQVSVMVDCVLPSPELERITDPVITTLREGGQICPVAEGLGARICPDGQLIGRDGNVQRGLSLLGRLAQGSVIAADSIHDCFGPTVDRWADGVIARAFVKS